MPLHLSIIINHSARGNLVLFAYASNKVSYEPVICALWYEHSLLACIKYVQIENKPSKSTEKFCMYVKKFKHDFTHITS